MTAASEIEVLAFVETKCAIGGVYCGMWSDWFVACEEADPASLDEDRDPKEIDDFPFEISECVRPETCHLALRARTPAQEGK